MGYARALIYKDNHLNLDVLDVEIKQAAKEPLKFVGSHGSIGERLCCLIPDLAEDYTKKWDQECTPNCGYCCCTIPAYTCACPINTALGIVGLFADGVILGHKKYQQHAKQQEVREEIDKILPPLQQAMR